MHSTTSQRKARARREASRSDLRRCADYGVVDAWLCEFSGLHNPSQNQFGVTPRDLLRRRQSALELHRLEGLANDVTALHYAREQAQAAAHRRAVETNQRAQAADLPRPDFSAGRALASITLTPRIVAQRPITTGVGAHGHFVC